MLNLTKIARILIKHYHESCLEKTISWKNSLCIVGDYRVNIYEPLDLHEYFGVSVCRECHLTEQRSACKLYVLIEHAKRNAHIATGDVYVCNQRIPLLFGFFFTKTNCVVIFGEHLDEYSKSGARHIYVLINFFRHQDGIFFQNVVILIIFIRFLTSNVCTLLFVNTFFETLHTVIFFIISSTFFLSFNYEENRCQQKPNGV